MMPRTRAARAFTLLEVLLAVGAAAVIAVGIAAVFAATGDIVTGGRRVSRFGRYAAQIEVQLRQDLRRISRDGYLVIRNERAAEGEDVPLFDGQFPDEQRPRRVDELMFFSRGQFTTARRALVPGHVARTDAARVYYGHGMPVRPDLSVPAYDDPRVDDTWANGGGPGMWAAGSVFGDLGPNRLASDWILLRHVTLLTQPRSTESDLPVPPVALNLAPENFIDIETQVGLQPAAPTVFRKLNAGIIPDSFDFDPPNDGVPIRGEVYPRFASGLVDAATTDLSEVRSVIVGMQGAPAGGHVPLFPSDINSENEYDNAARQWAPPPIDLATSQGREVLDAVQAWMLEGLPAFSHSSEWDQRVRVRCEPSAPNYLGMIADESLTPAELAYRPADQLMLTGSNFVPNCSEFIVEWSFGEVYPEGHPLEGQTVWHGMERYVDTDADGTLQDDELVARPYDATSPDYDDFEHVVPYRRDVPGPSSPFGAYPVGGFAGSGGIGGGAAAGVRSWLIHGSNYQGNINDGQLLSFFGYHEPTFDPTDPNRDGDPADAARADSLPWPWPRLLRVTVSLADPNEPSIEETYQFVIELPGNPEP